jgi:hypothetical protein
LAVIVWRKWISSEPWVVGCFIIIIIIIIITIHHHHHHHNYIIIIIIIITSSSGADPGIFNRGRHLAKVRGFKGEEAPLRFFVIFIPQSHRFAAITEHNIQFKEHFLHKVRRPVKN